MHENHKYKNFCIFYINSLANIFLHSTKYSTVQYYLEQYPPIYQTSPLPFSAILLLAPFVSLTSLQVWTYFVYLDLLISHVSTVDIYN